MTETACQIQWIWNLYEEIGFILGRYHYALITKMQYSLLLILLRKNTTNMFRCLNIISVKQQSLEKYNYSMFLLISNSLTSPQRIWGRPNFRMEEMLYIYRDIYFDFTKASVLVNLPLELIILLALALLGFFIPYMDAVAQMII